MQDCAYSYDPPYCIPRAMQGYLSEIMLRYTCGIRTLFWLFFEANIIFESPNLFPSNSKGDYEALPVM